MYGHMAECYYGVRLWVILVFFFLSPGIFLNFL